MVSDFPQLMFSDERRMDAISPAYLPAEAYFSHTAP
jgi:hypothetical protein